MASRPARPTPFGGARGVLVTVTSSGHVADTDVRLRALSFAPRLKPP